MKIGVDTAENEPKYEKTYQRYSYSLFSAQEDYVSSTVVNGALYDHEPINDLVISWRREPLCVSHLFVQA